MKLTVLLLTAVCMQVTATGFAQKVTITVKNVPVRHVLYQLTKQTGYNFIADASELAKLNPITLNVKNEDLQVVLEKCFDSKKFEFLFEVNETIVVRPRKRIAETHPSRPQRIITGIVTNEQMQPLEGVTVLIKGTSVATSTDANGAYQINVTAPDAVLVFNFLGYSPQELKVGEGTSINVALREEATDLEEILVVGYGTQQRKAMTAAVATVGAKELNVSTDANLASRLQGRAAGVTVSRDNSPGGEVSVRVRGFSSINNNDPLYVIDGIPTTGGLSKINSSDIETMTILKDASASAIYGSRAANGVIIVTTKRGNRGKPSLQVSSRYGMQQTANQMDLLNTREYGELYWLEFKNAGLSVGDPGWGNEQYGFGSEPRIPDYILPAGKMEGEVDESTYSYPDPYNGITRANKEGTNWYDIIFVNAPIQEHNIAATGGTEKSNYAFSVGYMDQKGVLDYTGFKRFTGRANGDLSITEWLKIGQSFGIANVNRTGASYNSEGGPIAQAYRAQPIIPVYDIRGNFAGTKSPTTGNASNPLAELYRNKDNFNNETRILANAYAQLDFWDNITFKTLIGVDHNRNRVKNMTLRNVEMSEARVVDVLNESYSGGLQYNWANTLNFQTTVGSHHDIAAMIGTEAVNYHWDWFNGSRSTYAFTDLDYMVLDAGEAGQASGGSFDSWATFSYFGRFNYSFQQKYLFEGVLRRDASSRFSEINRWGTFPAFSAGWFVSEEKFMSNVGWINELKVRGGWGLNGNDNVGNYNIYSTYRADGTASYYNIAGTGNSDSQAGYHKYKLGNPEARWESTNTTNVGLDVRLLNNRLDVNFDIFSRITKDMLYPDSRPATWGRVSLPSVNVGKMKNSGWDLMLTYRGRGNTDFSYTVQTNLSHFKNNVIALNDNMAEILYGSTIRNEVFTATKAGVPISSFYGYVVEGIFNTQEEVNNWPKYSPDINDDDAYSMPGVFKYKDVNGDGKITAEDRTFIGNPHPNLSYGINLDLQYKGWSLTMFFQGVAGNSIVNYAKRVTDFKHFSNNRSKERLYQSWTPERYANGAPISLPIALPGGQDVIMQNASSFFVEDGSYFRMKDLQIGYSFPKSITSKINAENLRVFLQATNLFTITQYSGLDPEIRQTSDRQIGVDLGIYPTAQTFMFGVNFSL